MEIRKLEEVSELRQELKRDFRKKQEDLKHSNTTTQSSKFGEMLDKSIKDLINNEYEEIKRSKEEGRIDETKQKEYSGGYRNINENEDLS